jgi:restriction system protein
MMMEVKVAEITSKRRGEILRGIFQILYNEPHGVRAKDLLQKLEHVVPPTPFEDSVFEKTNLRRYEKLARFHTISAVKAGWLVKEKGIWSLTDEGRKAYQHYTDPEDFERNAMNLYRKWAKEQVGEEEDEEDIEDASTLATLEEAEESAWNEIEQYLAEMNPYDFQKLVAGLLRGMGYHVSYIAPQGPDKGIDIIAYSDPLGIKGPRIKVQVKRRADRISVEGIRSFVAVLSDEDVGIFVTTGGFTKDAEDEARTHQTRKIMLIDMKKFFDLWVEHYDRIPDEYQRLMPLKPIYFIAPSE